MTSEEQKIFGCQLNVDYPIAVVPEQSSHKAAKERVISLRSGKDNTSANYWKKYNSILESMKQINLF